MDKRLSDYINNVLKEEGLEPKKKLTFDEWFIVYMKKTEPNDFFWWEEHGPKGHDFYEIIKAAWDAAKEN